MKKTFSYPIIFMVVITAFFTAILAFLNYSTADRIAYNQETELRKTILYVFDIRAEADNPAAIEKAFSDNIIQEGTGKEAIYSVVENGETKGYAFPVGGTGLWGSVEGYVGITADYTKLLGIDFVSHSETPGLGGRISEDVYKDQFRDMDLTDAQNGQYIIYRPAPGGNADAIAGATLTSKSVSNFINTDIENFIKERGNK